MPKATKRNDLRTTRL